MEDLPQRNVPAENGRTARRIKQTLWIERGRTTSVTDADTLLHPRHAHDEFAAGLSDQKMKRPIALLAGGLLVLSLALNVLLWTRLSRQSDQLRSAQASAGETDELRQQIQELQNSRTSRADPVYPNALELARLQNETGQLRKQAAEAAAWRAQAADVARLRAQLAAATQSLARAESELAEAVKLSPAELQSMKEEAQAVQCVNHLKQICLAARLWAGDHNHIFPPDFVSMQQELSGPQILFCPTDGAAQRVTEWSQVDPASISYRLLNPGGDDRDPSKPLATCPIHGHVGLSDGSVHRR